MSWPALACASAFSTMMICPAAEAIRLTLISTLFC
jgi:hypothetical protein